MDAGQALPTVLSTLSPAAEAPVRSMRNPPGRWASLECPMTIIATNRTSRCSPVQDLTELGMFTARVTRQFLAAQLATSLTRATAVLILESSEAHRHPLLP